MKLLSSFVALAAFAGLSIQQAQAAAIATDNASNSAYDNTSRIDDLDNGGTGFNVWDVLPDSNSGNAGNFIGNTGSSVGVSGESWGLYANGGATSEASRSFTAGGSNGQLFLGAGERFKLAMDNGFIENGGVVGFSLRNSSNQNRFEFYFRGGSSNYFVNINNVEYELNGASGRPTLGFTNQGLSVEFTQNGANGFSFAITRLSDNATFTITDANTQALTASDISKMRIFNFNAGPSTGGDHDAFFNSAQVIPEPTTGAVFGAGLALLAFMRRRRS